MKNRLIFPLLSILLVSLLFSPNAFSEDMVVRVAPRLVSTNDSPHVVDIVIENGKNIAGYQVMLQFNHTHLKEEIKVEKGDYLPEGAFYGEPKIINIDDSFKAVRFAATSFTSESNGYGVLATLTFDKLGWKTPLTLLGGVDGTLLSNKAGEQSFPNLVGSQANPSVVRDLVVESVQAIPKDAETAQRSYNKSDPFQLRATVRNIGNSPTGMTQLKFSGPFADAESKTVIKSEIISPNSTVEISLSNINVPAATGPYSYEACVVAYDNETIKDNNCSNVKIEVDPPDLKVTGMRAEPSTILPGKNFDLSVIVYNSGRTSDKTVLWWYYHGSDQNGIPEALGASRVDPLPIIDDSGGIIHPINRITVTAPEEPGTYYYSVSVDSVKGEVDTSNNNNHSNPVEVTVDQPDLVAQNIWISMPSDPEERETITLDPGDTFFLNFRYKKEGSGTKETSVQYYQSVNKTISKTDTPLLVGTSKLLSSNETKLSWSSMTVPQNPGTYYYGAYVESFEDEIDTGNNWSGVVTVTVRGKGLKIPGGLITDVAFTPNHTYFVLNPQFVSDNGWMNDELRQQCTVTLLLETLHRDIATNGETWDYYTLPLPPKIRRTKEEQAIDQLSGVVFQELIGKVPLLSLASKDEGGKKKKVSLGDIVKWADIILGFTEISEDENPRATITYYPNDGNRTSYEGDIYPILFMIQNKRLSSVGFKVEQVYYKAESWVPIKLDFESNEKVNEESTNIFAWALSPVWWIGAKALELVGIDQPLEIVEKVNVAIGEVGKEVFKKTVNFIGNAINYSIEQLNNQLLKNIKNQGDQLGHFTVEYTGEWNLEETFQKENLGLNAPSAQLMSLADYPPFRQLPPEIQEYLLQHFERTANPKAINAEAWQLPEKTTLLPNYPNPFNPETWIPYQLAEPADVTLTIYDIQGRIVRDLDLGHQRAGIYQSRARAAYWDGKNVVGEPVASGVYFYKLTAGEFTATRKMLIRK